MANPQETNKIKWNLDDGITEYFDFQLKGHNYRFTHMNTDEIAEMQKLEHDEEKSKEFIFRFISKLDDASPDFPEVARKMIIPQWRRFRKMIETEMNSLDGNN